MASCSGLHRALRLAVALSVQSLAATALDVARGGSAHAVPPPPLASTAGTTLKIGSAAAAQAGSDKQKVTLVTYMNEASAMFGFLQVSAAKQGLHPKILGYGDKAWWPDGLGAKINALRDFVFSEVSDEEIVLFVDAFDVMVFGSKSEVLSKFEELELRHNRSLFFNAEKVCFPDFSDICTDAYPTSTNPRWRYLNSGMFIGRGRNMKMMLAQPVDNVMAGSDQAFYQRYFLHNPDRLTLDYSCLLLCATQGIGPTWAVELVGRRLHNRDTGTSPSAVRFVSNAHWAKWVDGTPSTDIADVFQQLYPEASEHLFQVVEMEIRIGGSHRSSILSLRNGSQNHYHRLMRMVLCFRCMLFHSHDRECEYVPGITCDMCREVRIWICFSILMKFVVGGALIRKHGRSVGKILSKVVSVPPFRWCFGQATLNALRRLSGGAAEAFSKMEKAV